MHLLSLSFKMIFYSIFFFKMPSKIIYSNLKDGYYLMHCGCVKNPVDEFRFSCFCLSLWVAISFCEFVLVQNFMGCEWKTLLSFQFRIYLFYVNECFTCMSVCAPFVPGALEGQKRVLHLLGSSYRELWAAFWVLGSKPWLFARVSALQATNVTFYCLNYSGFICGKCHTILLVSNPHK